MRKRASRAGERLKRSGMRFSDLELSDRAAALTYYAVLSLFPGVALLVSILGMVGTERIVDGLLDVVAALGPESGVDTLREPIEQIAGGRSGAGLATLLSLAGTLWAASGYLGAFERAANEARGLEEKRRFFVTRPLQLGITLGMVLLAALILSVLLLTGPLADAVGDALNLDQTVLTAWSLAKWPALLAAAIGGITLLYWAAGGAHANRSPRELLPGSLLATLLWLGASAGFSLYISYFSSYDATYGSLGAVIIFLIWLYLTNAALLLGLVFNEE